MRYWLLGRSRTVRVLWRELSGAAAEVGWPRAVIEMVRLLLAL